VWVGRYGRFQVAHVPHSCPGGIAPPTVWPQGARAEVQIFLPCRATERVFTCQALAGAVCLDDPEQPAIRSGLDGAGAVGVESAGGGMTFRNELGIATHAGETESPNRQKRGPSFPLEAGQKERVAPARRPG